MALKRDFPGFHLLNYAQFVPAGSEEAFENAMRKDLSLPRGVRFAINPPGARDGYHPLTLLEPFDENRHVLGKDLAAVPGVRPVMNLARDTGKMTSSGMVIRPQGESGRVALAVRLPVYRVGMPVDTIEQRRAAYLGSVGAGIWLAEVLADIPGMPEGVRLRFFDGGPEPTGHEPGAAAPPAALDNKLLFDTSNQGTGRHPVKPQEPGANGNMQHVQSFALAGRLWRSRCPRPSWATSGNWRACCHPSS